LEDLQRNTTEEETSKIDSAYTEVEAKSENQKPKRIVTFEESRKAWIQVGKGRRKVTQ
jgi:hypothetical protein